MNLLRLLLRGIYLRVEGGVDRFFGPRLNPFYNLGTLGFFFYWIVAVSGIYIYIFFDTGITAAYGSVEYITHDQWYLAGVMRSLHRYASDGMVLVMLVHLVREFAFDRYRGVRWFSWATGIPILWLVFISGITGYWLVWDTLAQYVAITTSELLDWLPIFGEPIAHNFSSPERLDDRFFTLMVFLHVAIPIILLLILWVHLQRISRARVNPARGLAIGMFLMLLVLSLVWPAVSNAPADLATVPGDLNIDWFYLMFFPLIDSWSEGPVWGLAGTLTLMLLIVPWLPPQRKQPVAAVDLENCNGCTRCAEDCPYAAINMAPRSDGKPFDREAVVRASLCVSCGICAGACPTSTPFRRASEMQPGIDLPGLPLREVRNQVEAEAARLRGDRRVMVFGCDFGAGLTKIGSDSIGAVSLPCIGMLPPSFIDYVLSRNLADGIFLTGCRQGECQNRFGITWTEERLAGERDPRLRRRVPRERLATYWAPPHGGKSLLAEINAFQERLSNLEGGPVMRRDRPKPQTEAEAEAVGDD